MRIGTTPTNKFEIAEIGKEIPIDLIKALKITYSQNNRIILEKYKTDCQVETGKIILKLTQDETFKFYDTKSISIQIRLLTISRRAGQMLKCGWVEEAQRAIAAGLLESPTAHQALGYKIIKRYLDGEFDLAKLEELIVTATWQYARRQQTWFRHQHPELEVLSLS